MSIRLMTAVWQLKLRRPEKLVMLALSDHADDEGKNCYPGVRRLAWKTGYTPRHIQNIMAGLRDKGLIEPVAYEGGGRGHATEYHLHLAKGENKPPFRPERVKSTTKRVKKLVHPNRQKTS